MPATPAPTLAPEALANLAERYWRQQCEEHPLQAIMAGEPCQAVELFRAAPEDHERRARQARELRNELATLAPRGLSIQDCATHRLLEFELDDAIALHEVHAHLRPPLLPVGPDFSAIHLANSVTIAQRAEAELYVERLARFPHYLRDLRACLQAGIGLGLRYPRLVVDGAMAMVRAGVRGDPAQHSWLGPLRRSPVAHQLQRLTSSAERLVREELIPAWHAHAAQLAELLSPAARDSIACTDDVRGAAFYSACLRHYSSLDMPADQIHELGRSEVARLEREAAALATEAGFGGDAKAYRVWLASEASFIAPDADALLRQTESLAKRVDKCIPGFFRRTPRMTFGIELIPEAMAPRMPLAYAQPNPADRSAPGIYWLTCIPARCPGYMQLPTLLHEAWPGHLMHMALIQESTTLPAFRRHGALKYSACLEGWAMYCEKLGVEMGLYRSVHERYGRLELEMMRAARLVVDTGIHARGWSREQAIGFMSERMAMDRAAIAAEVDRYIGLPGQAVAYQLGQLRISALRARADALPEGRRDVRAFHDIVLSSGPLALPVLDEIVEDWLERGEPSAASHA